MSNKIFDFMKLKKLILVTLCISFYNLTFAQKNFSKELLKSYTKIELESFNDKDLSVLEYAIEHACYKVSIPEGKDTKQFTTIVLPSDSGTLRFTDLGLKIKDATQYFIVSGKKELLVVKSLYVLNLEKNNLK